MSIAVSTVIQNVRDILQDNPWMTQYAGSTTDATATTYDVPDGTRWDEGAIMEWQDNGEQDWVASVATNTLTVYTAINGTTQQAHVVNTRILRDPVFSYSRIQSAIEYTLQELYPQIYKTTTITVTVYNTQTWYDLATDFMAPIRVHQLDTNTSNQGVVVYGGHGSQMPVGVSPVPTALCASGFGMYLPVIQNYTNTIDVTYAAKFTNTQDTSSNYSDISAGMVVDIVAWGAASKLLLSSDVPRSTQDDTNIGDASVQSGMRARIARDVQKTYLDLRSIYAEELLRKQPPMSTGFAPAVYSDSYAVRTWY